MFKKQFVFYLFCLVGSFTIAQPFNKKYLMPFHYCNNCMGPQTHTTSMAESNDGFTWNKVAGFPDYPGSVPDAVIRGTKLYMYNPGSVLRYDNSTGTWDASASGVSVVDGLGNTVNFVDPSPIVDSSGKIVLFFLNSTGLTGQDPAGCPNGVYPCNKIFDSATEVAGSDGTQFVMNSGDRLSVNLQNSPQTGSDPDIYFDGTKYILYISKGPGTLAYSSTSMHGSYTSFAGLGNNVLTNDGGIPCGYFDPLTSNYWTYVNNPGNGDIRLKSHANFNSSYSGSTTVVSGTIMGLGGGYHTESPGFLVNDFLTAGIEQAVSNVSAISIFPQPANESISVSYTLNKAEKIKISIYDISGRELKTALNEEQLKGEYKTNVSLSGIEAGIYFIRINSVTKKMVKE